MTLKYYQRLKFNMWTFESVYIT